MNAEKEIVALKQHLARLEIEYGGQLAVNKVLTERTRGLEQALGMLANVQQALITFAKEIDPEKADDCFKVVGMELVPEEPKDDEEDGEEKGDLVT